MSLIAKLGCFISKKERQQRRESKRVAKVKLLLNSTMISERLKLQQSNGGAGSATVSTNYDDDDEDVVSMVFSQQDSGIVVQDDWSNVEYFILYWNLTDKQQEVFLELRDRIADICHPINRPNMVIRFLRARKFHLAKSEKMFRNSVQWRIDSKIDTIMVDYQPPQEIIDLYPGAILKGCDRDGDPIFVGRPGLTDLPGLIDKYGFDEMLLWEKYWRESVASGSWVADWEKKAGRPPHLANVVIDLRGMNRSMMSAKVIQLQRTAASVSQDNYPETTKRIIILGAPAFFMFIWSIAKNMFDPGVLAKVIICGSDEFLDVLGQHMDLDVLPPCINPSGHGEAVDSMPPNFEGGKVKRGGTYETS